MPPRNRPHEVNRGFTLVEAVIVIAIMAILASAATPMLMRALTQQRTRQTRDLVRAAYEALVGARDRSVPNLAKDVGFVPPAIMTDLRFLTTINPAAAFRNGAIPQPYPTGTADFTWGWNGPYWTGPVQSQAGTNGLPVDGWGRPLRWQTNQVQSRGPDGVWGTADDLVFPLTTTAPVSPQLKVRVDRSLPPPTGPISAVPVPITVTATYLSQQQLQGPLNIGTLSFTGENSKETAYRTFLPGTILIQVTNGADIQSQTISLASGETTRTIVFRTNF